MIFRSFVLDCSLSALSVYAATSSLHKFQKTCSIPKILNINGRRDNSAGRTQCLTGQPGAILIQVQDPSAKNYKKEEEGEEGEEGED